MESRQESFEEYANSIRRSLLEYYGENIAQRHAQATKALEQGSQDLQRLLDGTTNQHAIQGMEELAAAHQRSQQTDARIQAVKETYLLELDLRLQELNEALGAAANQLCIPFIGADQLASVTDITTMNWRSMEITCSDVAQPLRASNEAIGKYLLEQFGVETSE